MKAKGIKLVLRNKIDDWLSTIEDEKLRKLMKRDVIVTGGCIASMLLGEKVNDYDVYFRTYETTLAVARYYVSRFQPKQQRGIVPKIYLADGYNRELTDQYMESLRGGDDTNIKDPEYGRIKIVVKSAGIASEDGTAEKYQYFESLPEEAAGHYVSQIMDDPGDIQDTYDETLETVREQQEEGEKYRPVFLSTNAITLSHRIQVVIRFWGKPDEIHSNYDFAHCMNYWTAGDGKLILRPEALECLLTKELRYVGSKYPICSLIRIRKFVKRGFTINAGQILKMVWQVKELDLNDLKVLEDQLTGVDAAYFMEVIWKLKEKFPSGKIDNAYLVEIIDRMF